MKIKKKYLQKKTGRFTKIILTAYLNIFLINFWQQTYILLRIGHNLVCFIHQWPCQHVISRFGLTWWWNTQWPSHLQYIIRYATIHNLLYWCFQTMTLCMNCFQIQLIKHLLVNLLIYQLKIRLICWIRFTITFEKYECKT